jgi:hypothetical protein
MRFEVVPFQRRMTGLMLSAVVEAGGDAVKVDVGHSNVGELPGGGSGTARRTPLCLDVILTTWREFLAVAAAVSQRAGFAGS